MRASVYDEKRGKYRYYELLYDPGRGWVQRNSPIGTGIEDALPSLPLGAIPRGMGDDAQGVVLRPSTARKVIELGILGALAYGLVRWLKS